MISTIEEIHYWPVRDIDYAPYFQEVQPNGKTLSEKEREKFIAIIDDVVSRYISGFPMIKQELERISDIHDDYHILSRVVNSMSLFVLMTMTDMMIASKYFLKADKDYERRYMRGKLRVLQNEGFKKLYGFKEKSILESEWMRLKPFIDRFPVLIQEQYRKITSYLDIYSKSSSWWKRDRDLETHLDAEDLFISRQEEINESKVMMDSMKLYETLDAVNVFLTNAHACITNYAVKKYFEGEIKE